MLHSTLRLAAIAMALSLIHAPRAHAQYSYFPLNPCRVVDTRNAPSINGGPILSAGTRRDFSIKGICGVPSTAKAVSINLTITNPTASSWVTIWPAGQSQPFVSTINYTTSDSFLANGAIVGLAPVAQDLSVATANGQVHIVIDVTGYFQ
jgi:serine protease